jgi:hypothetical protein
MPPCAGDTFRAPPAAYRIDPDDDRSPIEVEPVGDIDGDGNDDVAVTSQAFRSVQGNAVRAIYLGNGSCVRFAGLVFGYLLDEPHDPRTSRPGLIFTSMHGNLHEEEHAEYAVTGGWIVGHRIRGCRTACEEGNSSPRCLPWKSLGGRVLPPDLWEGLAPAPDP